MYLDNIILRFIQPCTTDSNRIRIKAAFSRNISDILPYVNSYISNGIYNGTAQTFTFTYDGKIIILYSNEVNVVKLLNETDAFEILDYIKNLINTVDEKRKEIKPAYKIKKLPSPLEVYQYLPKLNCKSCGHETCIAFATKLIKGETKLKRCRAIYENSTEYNLEKLKEIILILGYEV